MPGPLSFHFRRGAIAVHFLISNPHETLQHSDDLWQLIYKERKKHCCVIISFATLHLQNGDISQETPLRVSGLNMQCAAPATFSSVCFAISKRSYLEKTLCFSLTNLFICDVCVAQPLGLHSGKTSKLKLEVKAIDERERERLGSAVGFCYRLIRCIAFHHHHP
jgi:hypothetical protein